MEEVAGVVTHLVVIMVATPMIILCIPVGLVVVEIGLDTMMMMIIIEQIYEFVKKYKYMI